MSAPKLQGQAWLGVAALAISLLLASPAQAQVLRAPLLLSPPQ